VEPSRIDESQKVRIVFFKESLSTGWDCPRAETMMSFRTANDYTYIAQLMGRMVRTPLHRRIEGDESLNNVHLFLPNYNNENVQRVIDALSSKDGEGIPSNIKKKPVGVSDEQELHVAEDKIEVFEWLNDLQLKTYVFNRFKVNNYLTSLFNLAYLAANTQGCDPNAAIRVSKQICKMIFEYIAGLKAEGTYNNKVRDIKQFILTESKMEYLTENKLKDASNLVLELTDYDIEREFARADSKLKNVGQRYIRDNYDEDDPMMPKVEVILFVQSEECMAELDKYAKATFYQYKHDYRKYLSKFSESIKSKYDKYTREGEDVSDHSWKLSNPIYFPKCEEQWEDRNHLFVDNEGKAFFSLNS
jgi:type III restriction enzyme